MREWRRPIWMAEYRRETVHYADHYSPGPSAELGPFFETISLRGPGPSPNQGRIFMKRTT